MRTKLAWLALPAVALLSLGLAACSSDNGNDDERFTPTNEAVGVFVTDDVGNLSSVNITFTSLTLFSSDGQGFSLTEEGPAQVDLVRAHDDPQYIGMFELPPARYDCIAGSIEVVDFTTNDTGNTCTLAGVSNVDIPKICLAGGILEIDGDNNAALLVDIPLVSGDCQQDGGTGSLIFGTPTVSTFIPPGT